MTEADAARRPPPAAVAAALVVIDACCTVGAWVAAGSAGLLAAMLILEVIVTSFFSWSQAWVVEYSMFLLAFVLFCVAASAAYFLNDALDVEADRRHDRKCGD